MLVADTVEDAGERYGEEYKMDKGRARRSSEQANGPKVSSIYGSHRLAKTISPIQEKQTYSVRACVVLVFFRTPRVGESQIGPWTHENDAPRHTEADMIAFIPQPPSQRHSKVPASRIATDDDILLCYSLYHYKVMVSGDRIE